jgi:microcin C transport system substrate-binding protein
LFYGQYTRIDSYFSNSELAAQGLPGEAELKYLEPLRDQVPPEVFTADYAPPKTDGSGNNRDMLRQAVELLKQAGWTIRDGRLVDASGAPLTIEFMIVQPDFERVIAPMQRNLKRIGIDSAIRTVDSSQYQRRVDEFDFDMVVGSWAQSLSPGNEQRDFWGSEAADRQGSRNLVGIRNPAVDALIGHVIAAESRAELIAATRALDRVLLWNHYVVPQFTIQSYRILYWDRFARPEIKPKYGIGFPSTWWIDRDKDAKLQAAR